MASTKTLQDAVNYASQCVRMAPLTGVGGIANQPAFAIGDWVRQFILAPPFAWRWNRNTTTYSLFQGTNYTAISPVTFGWLEKAYLTSNSGAVYELEVSRNLVGDSTQNQPKQICDLTDDGLGDIGFVTTPAADQSYTVNLIYQGSAPNFVNLSDTWSPIPDYFFYLIETGFLAKTYEYLNHELFVPTMSMFVKQVIAANAGLADSQKNIFMEEFINSQREVQSEIGNSQAGRAGRGLFG